MKKTLFMETTAIPAEQTIAEIQKVLVAHGARAIQTEYDGVEVSAVTFLYQAGKTEQAFKLPCRWQAIQKILAGRRKRTPWETSKKKAIEDADREQAKRVAWRQILRWIEAQLALVDTNMVKTEEVFMSYMLVGEGRTMFEMVEEKQFLLGGPTS